MAGGVRSREGLWRLVPEVRSHERGRFLFFFAVAGLLTLSQTMGFAGAEALFLGRTGVALLPEAFIGASLATVLASLLYGSLVGGARNDDLFVAMLLAGAALLAGGTAGLAAGAAWAPPVVFGFFFVAQAVYLTHFMTFASDYFDTLASKRMFPLFTIGSSLGGALGGALVVAALRALPAEGLVATWAVGLLAVAALLRQGRRRLRRWGPVGLEEADETSVENLRGAFQYLARSPFSRWLVLSALGMVLALFVSQYLYSDVFARTFRDAEALAAFFGAYLAVTNVIEVAVERWLTPWLIRRVGVASANLVHPVLTLLSFAGLAADYRLPAAVAARANRELLENALSLPVRNLVYNAIPLRFRGRMRVFLEGIVIYSGMSLAGVALLLVGRPDPLWLCAVGAATAVLYLLANLRVRRAYVEALVGELRAGRLDLGELGDELGGAEVARLAELWEALLPAADATPSGEVLELAPLLARRGVVEPLLRSSARGHPRVRRACVAALGSVRGEALPTATAALRNALEDGDAEVRLAALTALADREPDAADREQARLEARLDDPDPRVRAAAAALSSASGRRVLETMAASHRPAEAAAALDRLGPGQAELAARLAHDERPTVRAAALAALARLAEPAALRAADPVSALGAPDEDVRRGAVAALGALAALGEQGACRALAAALDDPAREVRYRAALRLGGLGDAGVEAAEAHLRHAGPWTVDAALLAVATAGTDRARRVLARELRARVRRAWESLLALHALGGVDGSWLVALRLAHQDAFARSARLAFRILELREGVSLMRSVQRALRLGGPRARADALEVIANLGDREAAKLLVLLLEEGTLRDKIREVAADVPPPRGREDVVARAEASNDRWVRRALRTRDAGEDEERRQMERLLALRQVPIFAHLSLDQLEAVHRLMRSVQYLQGEVIVREGEPGTELFLVLEGEVEIHRAWGSPQSVLLNRLVPVATFGEIAILDGERRSATAVAARDSHLLSLDGERLRELILQMPEISFEIFRGVIARLRVAEQRLEERSPPPGPAATAPPDAGPPR